MVGLPRVPGERAVCIIGRAIGQGLGAIVNRCKQCQK